LTAVGDGSAARTLVLEARGLHKSYTVDRSDHLAIADISLEVAKGEFVCIVGPSGAGKTTLLRCLSGLMAPSGGVVLLEGSPIVSVPPEVGIVFQDYGRSLFPWLSVARNVALPLKVRGIPKTERTRIVGEVLSSVGLGDVAARYPWQLSGGMQQRVAIARSLAYKPELLFMDEPFASVDAQTRFELEDLILRVRNEFEVTVVFVTHDVDEAVYLADRVVVLSRPPATVKMVVEIPLSRPRDQLVTRADVEFAALRGSLLSLVMGH